MSRSKPKKKTTAPAGRPAKAQPAKAPAARAPRGKKTPALLSLLAPTQTVEIRVRDAALAVVARGFGRLHQELPPGIYEVEYRAGDRLQTEIVALRAGRQFTRRNIDLPFASPVPLEGTSTSR